MKCKIDESPESEGSGIDFGKFLNCLKLITISVVYIYNKYLLFYI